MVNMAALGTLVSFWISILKKMAIDILQQNYEVFKI